MADRYLFNLDDCRKGGDARSRQASAQQARIDGGRARAQQVSFPAHQQQIAPLGFARTAARYGSDFARRKAATKRRRQPTKPEAWVEALLQEWGFVRDVTYYREVNVVIADVDHWLDFVVVDTPCGTTVVLQPGARRWHGGPDDTVDHTDRAALDDALDQALMTAYDCVVLRILAEDIQRAPDRVRQTIFATLRGSYCADEAA